jgi:class 3 adenylate cyclase/tetratricopeptide (TPR) repeat protein
MDVADWLRALGLQKYEAIFLEHEITTGVLAHLTADDLDKMGVVAVGHRRRLLEAIAILRAGNETAPASGQRDRRDLSQTTAERRQVSVMFCDMADSTALSTRLDPEDLSTLIREYQSRITATIALFNGFIARYVGDGVLIYFGWPKAHENDAEAAVRAALAIVAAIDEAPFLGQKLQVRIGIATGLVVIGAPIGLGDARQQTAIGETPNLAARLQGLAGANGIAIDEATYRQLGGLFEYRDLGKLELKGFPATVSVRLVLGESSVASRFDAFHGDTLAPIVGRDEELALLKSCWREAIGGAGQAILISGEAGIGKSRLIAEFADLLADDSPTYLRYFCSADQADAALHPVISGLQREACFARGDNDVARFNKLCRMLASTNHDISDSALIADMLSIRVQDRPPVLNASPQARKEATYAALLARFQALARSNPLLVILEDAHWADPSTTELFNAAITALADVAALVVISTRDDVAGGSICGDRLRTVTLPHLDRRHSTTLAMRVMEGTTVAAELLDRIVDQTDGIPLFIEELAKALLETASADEPNASFAVPASLQASLMARLDRIPLAKEVAQVGAVFGREFPYSLLAIVAALPEPTLQRGLQQLIDSGLATRGGSRAEPTYIFKHALVRDIAYNMLLRRRRRQLHSIVAGTIQEQLPELGQRQPELLAHHYTQAGLAEPAIEYWRKAADRSAARSALVEAVAQLRQGLALVPDLTEGPSRHRQEMVLQTSYGGALFALQAWTGGVAERAYTRALELAEQLGDVEASASILAGRVTYHIGQCQYSEATDISRRLLRIAKDQDSPRAHLIAHRCMAVCLHWTGDFIGALEHFDAVLGLYQPSRDRQLAAILGFDLRVQAAFLSCWDLLILGYPDRAVARFRWAREELAELDHKHSRVLGLGFGGVFSLLLQDRELAWRQLTEAVKLATEQRFAAWTGISNLLLGFMVAETADIARGLEQARTGYVTYVATSDATHGTNGLAVNATYYLGLLALASEAAGLPAEAGAYLDAAIDAAERCGERWCEPELYRLKGEWLLCHLPGADADAEACFRRAIHQARRHKALFWELRASIGLARHYAAMDASDRARDLLLRVVGRFDDRLDFPDIREARAMLARVRS